MGVVINEHLHLALPILHPVWFSFDPILFQKSILEKKSIYRNILIEI